MEEVTKKAEAFFIVAFLLSVFACTDDNIAQNDTNIYSDTIIDIKTTDVSNDTGSDSDTYLPDALTDTESCFIKCPQNMHCENNQCVCDNNFWDCNISNADGCETRINEDKFNCGKCKNDCTKLANLNSVKCNSGSCVIIECQYGFGNCDNYNSNGCEANFATEPKHCGNCSTDCGNNSICNNKICDCKAGFANCDKLWDSGCEIDTSSDRLNCGICGKQCKDINSGRKYGYFHRQIQ